MSHTFALTGGPPLFCKTLREECLWIEEGRRAICITYRYDVATGKLKFAASVFRRTELTPEEVATYWTNDDEEYVLPRDGVAYVNHLGTFYRELSDLDVENHHNTTTRRYEIRPAKVMVDPHMSYEDLIKTIRWEMCHGVGCRGPRKTRKGRSESPESVCSDVSSVSEFRVSEETFDIKTVFRARYVIDGREIFIAFKGRPSTGEILYGATIHRPDKHDSWYSTDDGWFPTGPTGLAQLTDEEVESHFQTAEDRLEKCPVHFKVPAEMRMFKKQLKHSAAHREDLTVMIVDNIFLRRGGHFQIRGERVDPEWFPEMETACA
jgi:hypothetical protein